MSALELLLFNKKKKRQKLMLVTILPFFVPETHRQEDFFAKDAFFLASFLFYY